MNVTNWNTLIELFGPDTDDWIGKTITIYPAEVAFKGRMTMALRISLNKPVAQKVSPVMNRPASVLKTVQPENQHEDSNEFSEVDIPF